MIDEGKEKQAGRHDDTPQYKRTRIRSNDSEGLLGWGYMLQARSNGRGSLHEEGKAKGITRHQHEMYVAR